MKLNHESHLSYCTNIHRGSNWKETFDSLNQYTLKVKERISPSDPFGIGLRLSHPAAVELSNPQKLLEFQRWLEQNQCYVFTINGFPYGKFHGEKVKEQVYWPDWTQPERLEYTNLLFDLLVQLLPDGMEGSVSTLPGSFKEFIKNPEQTEKIHQQLHACVEHISQLSQKHGRPLHLGLEPEPLGLFENVQETVSFFEQIRRNYPQDERLQEFLGVNYDTCHMAVEFEEAGEVVQQFKSHGIKISKIHLSSALKIQSSPDTKSILSPFIDDVYLHQVLIRNPEGRVTRYKDLDLALQEAEKRNFPSEEWRIHFHVPLHIPSQQSPFNHTSSHITDLFQILGSQPELCRHFEIETYTWEVLPAPLRSQDVVSQITREFQWCTEKMKEVRLASQSA